MSMSTSVYGIKPPDEKWLAMKDAYIACQKAGVIIPDSIGEFFGYEAPDDRGVVVDLEEIDAVVRSDADCSDVYEVALADLPSDVKVIRFVNSF